MVDYSFDKEATCPPVGPANAYDHSVPMTPPDSREAETADMDMARVVASAGPGPLRTRAWTVSAGPADARPQPADPADVTAPFETLLPGIQMVHFNTGEATFAVKVIAFNRDPKTKRTRFTVRVRFEHQTWHVFKYYTDFLRLRNALERSQFFELARDLPPKHPLKLKLRMKLSLTKRRAYRKEVSFIRYRMQRLELWLNKVLAEAGPGGVQHVEFLNDFFAAFPGDEPYNRDEPRTVNAKVGTSMFHALKSMAVPSGVYDRLWAAGYCFESLGSMSVAQWGEFGVSPVLAASLFAKFHRKTARLSHEPIPIPGAASAAAGAALGPQRERSCSDPTITRRELAALRERAWSNAAAIAAVAAVDSTPPSYAESTARAPAMPRKVRERESVPEPSAPPSVPCDTASAAAAELPDALTTSPTATTPPRPVSARSQGTALPRRNSRPVC